jgi:SAM-dependent methyltransferase
MNTEPLFNKYYFDRVDFVGGTTAFHNLCQNAIQTNSRILEIGCGPSNEMSERLSSLGDLEGADISPEALDNRFLKHVHLYDGVTLPVPTASFIACVSNYVLEHIQDPTQHFLEVSRVLKPGGVYCFRTPNLLHYVSFAAKVLPHNMHRLIANRVRSLPGDHHEPYRTYYRANLSSTIRHLARTAGLDVVQLHLIEKEPSYGKAHSLLFYPMLAYERLVNSTDLFAHFRVNIIAVLQKPRR